MAEERHGKCAICGAMGKLSFEHVPPKSAFNDRRVIYRDAEQLLSIKPRSRGPGTRQSNMGAGAYTLCEPCNNQTGAWYVNNYTAWAYKGMEYRYLIERESIRLPFHIMPGQVMKQIMCMFASACSPTFFEANPELRRYVLNRDTTGIPSKFRVYCYLISKTSSHSRQSAITAAFTGNSASIFSEIAFFPFGYILTIDSRPIDEELEDITYFSKFSYTDFCSVHLRLPVREINSYFPGDFRTEKEWQEANLRAMLHRAASAINDLP